MKKRKNVLKKEKGTTRDKKEKRKGKKKDKKRKTERRLKYINMYINK